MASESKKTYFTLKELISFGEYIASEEREKTFTPTAEEIEEDSHWVVDSQILKRNVTAGDVAVWKQKNELDKIRNSQRETAMANAKEKAKTQLKNKL